MSALVLSQKNRPETDLEVGKKRMERLLPYALAQLGLGATSGSNDRTAGSVRADLAALVDELGCGAEFIYQKVKLIVDKGPENIRASDFLKQAPSGGKGMLKIAKHLRQPLRDAVKTVCVIRGRVPKSKKARKEIREEMKNAGVAECDIPCAATIDAQCLVPEIISERAQRVEGDHMGRVMGTQSEILTLKEVVFLDVTTFSDEDDPARTLYALDDFGNVLGIVNAYFGLEGGAKDIWTILPFVKSQNADLTGQAILIGLLSKDSIFQELGLPPERMPCGKPNRLAHDNGSEFIAKHVRRVLDDIDLMYDETGPAGMPERRGDLERFNRTAHCLFADFLSSPEGKRYILPVPGKPEVSGIRFRFLRQAFWEWGIIGYRKRKHAGLGGATPQERFEDMANGRNGFLCSGYSPGVTDTPQLRYDFMHEYFRVIKHTGIHIGNRRYSHQRLAELFAPGKRRSPEKVSIRSNHFALGSVMVRLQSGKNAAEFLTVPYVYERAKLPLEPEMRALVENCSKWEWEAALSTLRRAGVSRPSSEETATVVANRISEIRGSKKAGAPSASVRQADAANRAMSEQHGAGAVTAEPPAPDPGTPSDDSTKVKARPSRRVGLNDLRLLPTGSGGANEY